MPKRKGENVTEEGKLRTEISDIVKLIVAESIEFRDAKHVWSHIKKHFGKSQMLADVPELILRKKFAEKMLEEAKAEREVERNSWPKGHTNGPSLPPPFVRETKKFVWPPRTDF